MASIESASIGEVHYLRLSTNEFEQLLEAMENAKASKASAKPAFTAEIIDLDAHRVKGGSRGPFVMPPST